MNHFAHHLSFQLKIIFSHFIILVDAGSKIELSFVVVMLVLLIRSFRTETLAQILVAKIVIGPPPSDFCFIFPLFYLLIHHLVSNRRNKRHT